MLLSCKNLSDLQCVEVSDHILLLRTALSCTYRGFDLGAMISNLLLSYFSQAGSNGSEYAEWVLGQLASMYSTFYSDFLRLWDRSKKSGTGQGELYKGDLYESGPALKEAQVRPTQTLTHSLTSYQYQYSASTSAPTLYVMPCHVIMSMWCSVV